MATTTAPRRMDGRFCEDSDSGKRYTSGHTMGHWWTVVYDPARPCRPFALVAEPRRGDYHLPRVFLPVRTFSTLRRAERAASRLA